MSASAGRSCPSIGRMHRCFNAFYGPVSRNRPPSIHHLCRPAFLALSSPIHFIGDFHSGPPPPRPPLGLPPIQIRQRLPCPLPLHLVSPLPIPLLPALPQHLVPLLRLCACVKVLDSRDGAASTVASRVVGGGVALAGPQAAAALAEDAVDGDQDNDA